MNIFKSMQKSVNITSIMAIVVGILFLIYSEQAAAMITKAIGVLILVTGICVLIAYIRDKSNGFMAAGGLIAGALLAIVGVFVIVNTDTVLTILGFIISIYIIIDGLIGIDSAIALGRGGISGWPVHLVLNALLAGAGVYLLLHPIETVGTGTQILGVVLLFNGVLGLITAYRNTRMLRAAEKEMKRAMEEAEAVDVEAKEVDDK